MMTENTNTATNVQSTNEVIEKPVVVDEKKAKDMRNRDRISVALVIIYILSIKSGAFIQIGDMNKFIYRDEDLFRDTHESIARQLLFYCTILMAGLSIVPFFAFFLSQSQQLVVDC